MSRLDEIIKMRSSGGDPFTDTSKGKAIRKQIGGATIIDKRTFADTFFDTLGSVFSFGGRIAKTVSKLAIGTLRSVPEIKSVMDAQGASYADVREFVYTLSGGNVSRSFLSLGGGLVGKIKQQIDKAIINVVDKSPTVTKTAYESYSPFTQMVDEITNQGIEESLTLRNPKDGVELVFAIEEIRKLLKKKGGDISKITSSDFDRIAVDVKKKVSEL